MSTASAEGDLPPTHQEVQQEEAVSAPSTAPAAEEEKQPEAEQQKQVRPRVGFVVVRFCVLFLVFCCLVIFETKSPRFTSQLQLTPSVISNCDGRDTPD